MQQAQQRASSVVRMKLPSASTTGISSFPSSLQNSHAKTTSSSKGSSSFFHFTLVAILYKLAQLGIAFILHLLVPSSSNLVLPSEPESSGGKSEKRLFPSISNPIIQHEQVKDETDDADAVIERPSTPVTNVAQPCSTGLTTRLLPFKNAKGEIEWAFTDDVTPGNELDVFKMSRFDEKNAPKPKNNNENENEDDNLSPTISNSSNNESILSNNSKKLKTKKEDEDNEHTGTPLTNHSSPFSPEDDDDAKEKEDLSSSSSDNLADSNEGEHDDVDDEDKVHQCPHCDATFKIRGYLTRHLKKHATKKAYSCPFHKFSIYIDENNITHKCHPNGGFSRRDTYKTHLKSRHFKYPKGTKTKDRANSPGTCSMCGCYFPNAEIWCELHVEGGECKFLPEGFKGKSRIKNRLKKQLSKLRKSDAEANELTSSIINSHYLNGTSMNGNLNSNINGSMNGISNNNIQDVPTPYINTPNSVHSIGTPAPMNSNPQYEYHNSQSPESVVSHTQHNTPMSTKSPISYSQILQAQVANQNSQARTFMQKTDMPTSNDHMVPQFEQFTRNSTPVNAVEDYDDEYCLDVDQLNTASLKNYNEVVDFLKNQTPSTFLQQQQFQQPANDTHPSAQLAHFLQEYQELPPQPQVQYQQQYQPSPMQQQYAHTSFNQGMYQA